eukprot:CAMPEP_0115878052 /NCGR_PEP_ID=MMETSP0287-20121206/26561_1 /TAXON_ID=412157 /ORGANISM="Chrysochromulina rotalis, Strain UIO044" /LENGTH=33 /DNA_ID= /DNA_START= /DNA_END= /DNA_ORIENTATION=
MADPCMVTATATPSAEARKAARVILGVSFSTST